MDFSAISNPSADPSATEISLTFYSLARLSTLNEGSKPGAEQSRIGDLLVASFSTISFRSI
jgi:hypothetical protein